MVSGSTDPLASLAPRHDEAELAHAKAVVESRLLGKDPFGATKIGRFVVLERLAAGGMGLVFAGYDPQLDRKVAVKLLHRESSDTSVRTRMIREAQAMAKLSHPNVAQVYDVGEDRGRTFIAMEFIVGVTLAKWQVARRLAWRELLGAYVQAGRGLAAAHAAGLVHRDFKPDNAMVGQDGRVRVLDFGLARVDELEPTGELDLETLHPVEDAMRTRLTHEGSILGTPAYMAPEQLAGTEVDAKADQFGFCVAMWEALFGARPFDGTTRAALLANIAAGSVREPPRDVRVPGWLRSVLVRGLAASPGDRHASMDALLAALARDPSRRRRRAAVLVAGAAIVAVGFAARWLDRSRTAEACAEDAAGIAALWNPETRSAVESALVGVGPSYGASTAERVLPRLDAWAASWSLERERNCVAHRIDRTRSDALAMSAEACLDERRAAFETLLATLGAADDAVLQNASVSVETLADPSSCVDEAMLQRRASLRDANDASTTAELWRSLAATEVLLTAHRIDEALATAERVIDESSPLGPHAVRARAMTLAASAHAASGDHARAAALAEESVVLAIRVGDDEVAFDGIMVLTGELVETGERERGRWWTNLAEALVARMGQADDLRGAALLEARAQLGTQAAERLALFEQALAIRERVLGSDHPLVGLSVSNVGATMELAGDGRGARAFHERALAIRELALGPDHPHVGNSLINVGQSYMGERDFPRALAAYGRALAIWERALGPDHRNCALALGNLAAVHLNMDDIAGAQPLLERAIAVIEHAHESTHPMLVGHLVNLAWIRSHEGDDDEAARLFERAIAIGESWGGASHPLVAAPLVGLAEIELASGRTRAATARLERALAIFEHHPEDRPNLAHARWVLARALWDQLPQRKRATELAHSAIAEYRDLDGDWSEDIAKIEAWLAAHATR